LDGGGVYDAAIDGGGGINTLIGTLGDDVFDIIATPAPAGTPSGTPAAGTTVTLTTLGGGGVSTTLTTLNVITGFVDDGTGTITDAGSDQFNINDAWAGGLSGGAGADVFNFNVGGSVAGNVDGDAGTDSFKFVGGDADVVNGGTGADILN